MTIIKKINNKCWQGNRKTETLMHCGGTKKWYSWLWKNVWQFLKSLHIPVSI